jgi:hypothetical protein
MKGMWHFWRRSDRTAQMRIRLPPSVTGEIAEYEAAHILNLELSPARQTGYDAIRTSAGRGPTPTDQEPPPWPKARNVRKQLSVSKFRSIGQQIWVS